MSEETGIDDDKKINGRMRTILVDKLGLPMAIKVTGAIFRIIKVLFLLLIY